MKKMNCAGARQIDLVDYLSALGHEPQKIQNQNYWYLSPLREEKTASFKVSRRKGFWFDFGTGQGGDIIDFGVLYYKCDLPELLERLTERNQNQLLLSHPQSLIQETSLNNAGEEENRSKSRIVINDIRPLGNLSLSNYIESRCISLEIARQFCQEVDFVLLGKKQTAIGFQNDSGGYELRSRDFKGSSSPKSPRFIDNGSPVISVFEGFFDFLSFKTINKEPERSFTNSLILNSLSFLDKKKNLMEKHKTVHLFLDRDHAGITQTTKALRWNKSIYVDNSHIYKEHPDLNDWLISNHQKLNLSKTNIHKPVHKQIKIKRHGGI